MLLPGPHFLCIPDYITEKNYQEVLTLMTPEERVSAKTFHELVAVRDEYISRGGVGGVITILIPVLAGPFGDWCKSRQFEASLAAAAYYATWLHMASGAGPL